MQKVELKPFYDVVVIGGGISGLTSAALFSRAGLSCCVIEMDNRPGGYLAGFRRKDFRFDSAIHWLNNCGPDGFVTKIFKIIGDDYPKAKTQTKIKRFKGKGIDYLLTNNPDELKERWIKEFPEEKKGITRFFNTAKKLGKHLEMHTNLSRTFNTMNIFEKSIQGIKLFFFAFPFFAHLRFSGNEGVKKGLNRYFKSEKLHAFFCSELDMLSCLIPIAWAYSKDFQTPPSGGSQSYPEWLVHTIEKMGNDVFFKCKAKKLLLNNTNSIHAVEFDHRGKIMIAKCNYVITACDVETVYEKMLPENAVPQKLKNKLKSADLYASALTVAIGIDCPAEELGLGEELVFIANPESTRKDFESGDPHKSGIHVLASTVRDKTLALKNEGTVTIFIPAWIHNNNFWGCEIDKEGNYIRTEKYEEIKKQYADILIKRVEEAVAPELGKHIVYCDIATPITHWRYTGNKNGTMMGARPGKKNIKAGIAHYKTPIKNLFLSGHWSELGGGIPLAAKSAINTTLIVLQKEKKQAFKLLAKYMDGKIGVEELKKSTLLKHYDNSWVQELSPAQKREAREIKISN